MQDSHLFMAKRIFSKSLCKCIPSKAELLQKSLQLNDWLTNCKPATVHHWLTDWLTHRQSECSLSLQLTVLTDCSRSGSNKYSQIKDYLIYNVGGCTIRSIDSLIWQPFGYQLLGLQNNMLLLQVPFLLSVFTKCRCSTFFMYMRA